MPWKEARARSHPEAARGPRRWRPSFQLVRRPAGQPRWTGTLSALPSPQSDGDLNQCKGGDPSGLRTAPWGFRVGGSLRAAERAEGSGQASQERPLAGP